jgi:hypothetical protein
LLNSFLVSFVLNVLVHEVPDVGTGFFQCPTFQYLRNLFRLPQRLWQGRANEFHRVLYIRTLFYRSIFFTWGWKEMIELPSIPQSSLSVRYHTPLPFFIISFSFAACLP